MIQCKHRRDGLAGSAVGTPDLQVLNGTARHVHGADVAVLVTNGRVTAPAVVFARQQRLHVVDRHTLGAWAADSRPLWELLRDRPVTPQTDLTVLNTARACRRSGHSEGGEPKSSKRFVHDRTLVPNDS